MTSDTTNARHGRAEPFSQTARDPRMTEAGWPVSRRDIMALACALPLSCAARAVPGDPGAPGVELYDSHIHFFTNDIGHYPIDTRNSREGEEVTRARVMRDPGTPEKVFAWWAQSGVTAGTGVQYSGVYKTDNSYVLDLADRFPDKIHAEIIMDARNPASPDRLEALVAARRVSAMRLTGFTQDTRDIRWLNSPDALRLWATADRLGIPVGITFLPPKGTVEALSAVRTLAERFTNCPIILEHCGRLVNGDVAPAHLALRAFPHVHFKWTTNVIDELKAQAHSPAELLRRATDIFGADRIMWGSDSGNTLWPYADMVADALASTSALNADERRRVLHDNGHAMFTRRKPQAI
ncbi:amidohydrolase family protein [Sphingobium lignivorans]|uniref:TIM-barrel fold metal-dependent hydrolase n=1 Tax=Sphingobium lignivorans TaxID=2735886 RepID=A0ABR6NJS8_9SPHN|nr:amidohydrolase family protein [Sphingobium lignivorans]MBB5987539.1 putative TIM-barrel fold metal-dependent hydrolase [Sphingobium lignivorans]